LNDVAPKWGAGSLADRSGKRALTACGWLLNCEGRCQHWHGVPFAACRRLPIGPNPEKKLRPLRDFGLRSSVRAGARARAKGARAERQLATCGSIAIGCSDWSPAPVLEGPSPNPCWPSRAVGSGAPALTGAFRLDYRCRSARWRASPPAYPPFGLSVGSSCSVPYWCSAYACR